MKRTIGLALLVFLTVLCTNALCAETGVKLTFNNKTDREVSIAVYREIAAFTVKGWYNVGAGESRTITFKTEPYEPVGDVGFYAKGFRKGQKTVYWRGDFAHAWVHPNKAFNYRGGYQGADNDDYNNYTEGAPNQEVGFRKITMKSRQGTVNLTLK